MDADTGTSAYLPESCGPPAPPPGLAEHRRPHSGGKADQRTQFNEWLISVAQRVAEAPYGKDDEVSARELAAIERLRELLS